MKALSAANIALIKYWGNRNDALRLPVADSLSITLDQPTVEIAGESADVFSVRSYEPDGSERKLTDKEIDRLQRHFEISKQCLDLSEGISLEIRSQIPPSIGFASSAAIFSSLAELYSGLSHRPVFPQQKSIIARLGSGSAARSVFGGFMALRAGNGDTLDSSFVEQIADSDHWRLWDIIIVPSHKEKKTGSTEGHARAHTSPLFEARIRSIPKRMEECIDAILKKDFEKLQAVSEEDCMNMHAAMQSQDPPLHYLSQETYRLIDEVKELRMREHLEVLFTMDAGPTVHLICTEAAFPEIRAFAKAQTNCTVFEAGIGSGSHLL